MPRVLCFDDRPEVLENIKDIISTWDDSPHGPFEVTGASSFDEAISRLKSERFDVVTLDVHGADDPEPLKDDGAQGEQVGLRILTQLRMFRFVPVIFYTGYADKIKSLESGVVKIVKKGDDDLNNVRSAVNSLYSTGISRLLTRIEEENTRYLWDTIDKSYKSISENGGTDDLAYLVARRLGARLSREFIKDFLDLDTAKVSPIEMYIYPPHDEAIRTGCILRMDNALWVVATPACDFAQKKAESVLLIAAKEISSFDQYKNWDSDRWDGIERSGPTFNKYSKLLALISNKAGDRFRFLPGTFFLKSLVVDFQSLRQIQLNDLRYSDIICRVDSPFREELLNQLSRYYGRMGTPEINAEALVDSFK